MPHGPLAARDDERLLVVPHRVQLREAAVSDPQNRTHARVACFLLSHRLSLGGAARFF